MYQSKRKWLSRTAYLGGAHAFTTWSVRTEILMEVQRILRPCMSCATGFAKHVPEMVPGSIRCDDERGRRRPRTRHPVQPSLREFVGRGGVQSGCQRGNSVCCGNRPEGSQLTKLGECNHRPSTYVPTFRPTSDRMHELRSSRYGSAAPPCGHGTGAAFHACRLVGLHELSARSSNQDCSRLLSEVSSHVASRVSVPKLRVRLVNVAVDGLSAAPNNPAGFMRR